MHRLGLAISILALALAACDAAEREAATDFQLGSSAFADGAVIPAQFTCDGDDHSPPLRWSGAPAETKSFVLVVDDPDAPGGTFRHWAVFDIAAGTSSLPAGAGNDANAPFRQATNGFDKTGYGGPCPPPRNGPHRYRFKLYALDAARLPLGGGPSVEQVENAAEQQSLALAELTGSYERR